MPCTWPGGTAIVPWFRPVPARPRTPPSPTWPSPPPPARSRSARWFAPNGWPSTTGCCGSKRCLVPRVTSPVVMWLVAGLLEQSRSLRLRCSRRSGPRGGFGGGRAGGKQKRERRALAKAALGTQAAVVGLDDIAANRQAEAGAAQARGVGAGLGREERFEDAPQVPWRDADAVIDHAQLGKPPRRIGRQPQIHHAALRHRLASVDQQVDQN